FQSPALDRRVLANVYPLEVLGDAMKSDENHSSVIDIGIELVAVLEVPAARLEVWAKDRPVAGFPDFTCQEPVVGSTDASGIHRALAFMKRDAGEGRVP